MADLHYPQSLENNSTTKLAKFLIFLAFAIPIALLGYALYINYLPFGYEKTYTLTIDENGIITPLSNEIYLATPQGKKLLSLPDGVQGQVNTILDPNTVLRDTTLNVSLEGDEVYLGNLLKKDLSVVNWNYNWNFSESIPENFEGTAKYSQEEQCVHFNTYNQQTLTLLDSQNLFENGPMSIYISWKPSQFSRDLGSNQQIVGHYNWEIWQSDNELQFRVGRMNNQNGTFHSITYPISQDFFGIKHEALAVYSPNEDGNGYIEFWVDNKLAGRVLIGSDKIYQNYNGEKDLSFGWSPHNNEANPYFDGCLYLVKITNSTIDQKTSIDSIKNPVQPITIPIIGNGKIKSITITVIQ